MKNPLFIFLLLFLHYSNAQNINTMAGTGTAGFFGDGLPATSAQLDFPDGIVTDANGNTYICDDFNNRIRKVDQAGLMSTIAGTNIGAFFGENINSISAVLDGPQGMTIDQSGNIYFCDANNVRIRKISPSGIITTVAGSGIPAYGGDGGIATSAGFVEPYDVAVDATGNIYVADKGDNRIRKINPSGIISTIAGDGSIGFLGDGFNATVSKLNNPMGICVDPSGNIIFCDNGNNRIRKISASGIISTIAGSSTGGFSGDGGPASAASITEPRDICSNSSGTLFFVDGGNFRIRSINTNGIISTVAGNGNAGHSGDGGPALQAGFNGINSVHIDGNGNIFVSDAGNRVRIICPGNSCVVGNEEIGVTKPVVSLYPNPANNNFTISSGIKQEDGFYVSVYDYTGELIALEYSIANQYEMSCSSWPRGIYLIVIKLPTASLSFKQIVE